MIAIVTITCGKARAQRLFPELASGKGVNSAKLSCVTFFVQSLRIVRPCAVDVRLEVA